MPTIVDRREVERLLAAGAQLVDVREQEAYREAHIPGAISLPLKELTAERAGETLRRDRTVLLYCWDFQ
ncbi:MAG: rhodanese-like domain-containing protein [Chloroflexota bacterium]|nr:rhodanese-like domain-containing protein [Chloroflexota bacterium]